MTTEAMRAEFEAWYAGLAGNPSAIEYNNPLDLPAAGDTKGSVWLGYQAALRSPAVVGLVEALRALVHYDASENNDTSLLDQGALWAKAEQALAQFATLAKGEGE